MLNHEPRLDHLFHALADPTRRTMLELLSRGPMTVSDLARPLPMTLPAAMQHLQVLESAGLVQSTKQGRVRTCRMRDGALDNAERWLASCRQEWEARLDRLEAYLDGLPRQGD